METPANLPPIPEFKIQGAALSFSPVFWDKFSGRDGAWVSVSTCGKYEAVEAIELHGWVAYLVETEQGGVLERVYIGEVQ